jgi:hypothetical protein
VGLLVVDGDGECHKEGSRKQQVGNRKRATI